MVSEQNSMSHRSSSLALIYPNPFPAYLILFSFRGASSMWERLSGDETANHYPATFVKAGTIDDATLRIYSSVIVLPVIAWLFSTKVSSVLFFSL